MWPVALASYWLSTLVRLLLLILVFFQVTFIQFIAATSDFFIGIKDWFDQMMFGWLYALVNFLWTYVFALIFTVPWVLLVLLGGLWYGLNYVLRLFLWVFSYYNGLYWGLFWWLQAELNPFYQFLGNIWYYVWWIWVGWIFGGVDDLCDIGWDAFDDFADVLISTFYAFVPTNFVPGMLEIPFASPLIFIDVFLG